MSVVASLLHSLRFLVRSRAALHLEIVALRHQLVVTSRSRRRRLRLTALDRVLWAWLAHRWRDYGASRRAAGDRPRMASSWFSSVLALEGPTSDWPVGCKNLITPPRCIVNYTAETVATVHTNLASRRRDR